MNKITGRQQTLPFVVVTEVVVVVCCVVLAK